MSRRPSLPPLLGALAAIGLACAPARAQAPAGAKPAAPAGAPQGQGFASGGPVDVTSQWFERVAIDHLILHGDVEAVQGVARLRSPKIDVFTAVRSGGEHAATVTPSAAAAGAGGSSQIQRMEAEGPVYYVTPTQTAKGDHGTYLAADDTITLLGHVILTQGQDVSTGDKLVIHQKTNQATLTAAAGQRTRAILYPAQPAAGAPAKPPR